MARFLAILALLALQPTAISAGELTSDQAAIVTSSSMLFAASRYCDETYKIDEDRVAMLATMAGIDAQSEAVRAKMESVVKSVDDTVNKVGVSAYCDYLYGVVGGVSKGSLMLRR
ncbi:exported hypothetical protein [uncultured Pleomorphomonas sp.]|uniref:Uncharacterized protein n=1 Tax=uncultured Pleomorphomonas sp. TaxID=442121 RepID=A0A212L7G9_9HYPH|nr:hypothetical protein [uncultured Pleomorphomonas sp.]SCM73455.1 exported hypothetical protein [uncultured Pleomorphomonas sp.]